LLGWIWLLSVRIAAGRWWETIPLPLWIWIYTVRRRDAPQRLQCYAIHRR